MCAAVEPWTCDSAKTSDLAGDLGLIRGGSGSISGAAGVRSRGGCWNEMPIEDGGRDAGEDEGGK